MEKAERSIIDIKKHRKIAQRNSRKKQRDTIKSGFEKLKDQVISLSDRLDTGSSVRFSREKILQKSVDCCKILTQSNQILQAELRSLKSKIDKCTEEVGYFHQQVSEVQDAAAGCSRSEGLECNQIPRSDRLHDMLDKYVENNSNHCKFWIYNIIVQALFQSYINVAATSNQAEFYRAVQEWINEHCTLDQLRPVIIDILAKLLQVHDF